MKIYAERNWRVSQVCFLLGVRNSFDIACWQGHCRAVTTLKLVNWSSRKLESKKNQLSPSQLSKPGSQENSLGEDRTDQDRSGEQRTEPVQSYSAPAVTDSLSEQSHLAPGPISLPSSPSRENLNFSPPFHFTKLWKTFLSRSFP